MLLKEKAKKEAELRELAMKARMEKGGAVGMASRMDAAGESDGRRAVVGSNGALGKWSWGSAEGRVWFAV